MTKSRLKKTFLWTGFSLVSLTAILFLHIYLVMRPKAPDSHTRIMARIDIKTPIDQDDANKITSWLYGQHGVDHVLCNAKTGIAVFTYAPVQTSADAIVAHFKSSFPFPASRYVPSEADMAQGCPVIGSSSAYKIYKFLNNIFN